MKKLFLLAPLILALPVLGQPGPGEIPVNGGTGYNTVLVNPTIIGGSINNTFLSPMTANIYVRTNGSDATAARNTTNAFNTLSNAFVTAQSGDIIDVGPGTFGITNTLFMKPNMVLRGVAPWVTRFEVSSNIVTVTGQTTQFAWICPTNICAFYRFSLSKSLNTNTTPGYPFANLSSGNKITNAYWEDVDWIGENDTFKYTAGNGGQFEFNRCHVWGFDDGFLLNGSGESNHVIFKNSSLIMEINQNTNSGFFNASPNITGLQIGGTLDIYNSYVAEINPQADTTPCVLGDYVNVWNDSFFSTYPGGDVNNHSEGYYLMTAGNFGDDKISIYSGQIPVNRVDSSLNGGTVFFYQVNSNYWNTLDQLTLGNAQGLTNSILSGPTNPTAPASAVVIKAWANFTNSTGGVFKLPLYQ